MACSPFCMAYRSDSEIHDERHGEAGRHAHLHWVRGGHSATRPMGTPIDADDAVRADDAISIDEVVERLSRDMAAAVNRAAAGERDELRDYASMLAREQTETAPRPRSPTKRARLTLFSLAMWLVAAGLVLAFLLPPAGIVCLLMACLAGVMGAIVGSGDPKPEQYRVDGDQGPDGFVI